MTVIEMSCVEVGLDCGSSVWLCICLPTTHCASMSVHLLTSRYGVHAHAECVESPVTFVAEHHLVLMVGLLAHGARLTLHTLPAVRLDHTHQLHAHVQAGRMA